MLSLKCCLWWNLLGQVYMFISDYCRSGGRKDEIKDCFKERLKRSLLFRKPLKKPSYLRSSPKSARTVVLQLDEWMCVECVCSCFTSLTTAMIRVK